ncbi:MAG: hypothetical protein R3C05_03705 [Pirellulaceae bacterium]
MATANPTTDRGDAIISQHIEKTRRALWLRELLSLLIVWAIGLLSVLFAWSLADHWLLQAGAVTRVLVWMFIVGGSIGWFVWRVLPVLRHSIHPEFAAQSLERRLPELHHSLLSYLTLRSDCESPGLRGIVVRSVASHAARRLSDPEAATKGQENRIAWLGGILAALIILLAAYAITSPKDVLQSVQRVAMPLSRIDAPTQVRINDVTPGDAKIVEGTSLPITARIAGLRDGQQAVVQYNSGSVDPRIPMRATDEGYVAVLGDDDHGVRRALSYEVVAGDARSGPYQVTIEQVPIVTIDSVLYEPASYTGLPQRTTNRGAIDGLEGTLVTLFAKTNRPIEKAKIEFNPKQIGSLWQATGGVREMEISEDQRTMTTQFVLRRPSDERGVVAIESYRILVEDHQQLRNDRPVIYPVQVAADLPPEVSIIVPEQSPKDLPIGMEQLFEVHAIDPDFGLTRMEFEIRKGERLLSTQKIFASDDPLIGQQVSISKFRPEDHQLQVGDHVIVRCRAFDNRDMPGNEGPDPNTTLSAPVELRIVAQPEEPETAVDGDGLQKQSESSEQQQDDSSQQESGGQKGGSAGEGAEGGKTSDGKGEGKSESNQSAGDNNKQNEESPEGQGTGKQEGEGKQSGKESQSANGEENAKENPSEPSDGNKGSDASNGSTSSGAQDENASASQSTNPGSDEDQTDTAMKPSEESKSANNGGRGDQRGDQNATGESGESSDDGPLHDGEIMERIRQHMEKERQQNPSEQQNAKGRDNAEGQQNQGQQQDSGEGASESDALNDQRPPNGDSATNQAGKSDANQESRNPQASKPEGGSENNSDGTQNADAMPGPDQKQSADPNQNGKKNDSGKNDSGKNDRASDRDEQNDASGDNPSSDGQSPKSPSQQNDRSASKENVNEGGSKNPSDQAMKPSDSDEPPKDGNSTQNADASKNEDSSSGQKPAESEPSADEGTGESKTPSGGTSDQNQKGTGDRTGSDDSQGAENASDADPKTSGNETSEQENAGKSSSTDSSQGKSPADSNKPPGNESQSNDSKSPRSSSDASRNPQAGKSNPKSADQSKPERMNPNAQADANSQGSQAGEGAGADGDLVPDAVNEQYANEATDLVLDYLRKNQDNPDAELLDDLNWTEQDLQEFVNRWQRAKELGRTGDAEERQDYLEQLKSLGMRPPTADKARQTNDRNDSLGGVRQSGQRTAPPAVYRDAFEAFRKSLSTSDRKN